MAGAANASGDSSPRFTVVVPTFQRRDLVRQCVRSLERQRFDGSWEVVVVVDGSTDGTAGALREMDVSVPLRVVEQPNLGLSAARNRGAAEARGELVLFLDDDMEADADMLAEHDRSHREGADAVMGDMPMHPDSAPGPITEAVAEWTQDRIRRLSRSGAPLTYRDLLGGQLSIRRDVLEELGGFDRGFTAEGAFGGEDIDFGYRLIRSGRRVVFNPRAVSRQRYVVTPRQNLRQWRDAGRATVALLRKHPEIAAELDEMVPAQGWVRRRVWLPVLRAPALGAAMVGTARTMALAGLHLGPRLEPAKRLFFAVRDMERLRGVIDAGGMPEGPQVCVLAYHAVEDLRDDPVLAPYGGPAYVLRRQLEELAARGFRFVGLSEALSALRGEAPEDARLALVTFDDCYPSVLDAGLPVLRDLGIPAVAFAVSGQVGGTNEWDRRHGARELPLLDSDGLKALRDGGVEIGAHSRTHPSLSSLDDERLADEVGGSADDLERLGLPRPRVFAYPHGDWSAAARSAVRAAGLEAAFTVQPAIADSLSDRFTLPRVEMTPVDVGRRLRLKLAAARAPGPIARRVARRSLRSSA